MASVPPSVSFQTDEEKGHGTNSHHFDDGSSGSSSTDDVANQTSIDLKKKKRADDHHIILTKELSQQTTQDSSPLPAPAFDPRQNPDGGAKAWLCVLGSFCILFCSFGWINCIGIFQDYYQMHLLANDSSSTISWIPSLQLFFMFFFGPVIGTLYDRYGPRPLLLVGSVLEVLGLMMMSLSTQYYQLLLSQGVCASLGASLIFYPGLSVLPTWFFKKRGQAYGIVASGSSLGGVLLPIMVQRLIPTIGFPWAIRVAGFLMLFLLVIANLTVTSRMPPRKAPFNPMLFVQPFKELPFILLLSGSFLFFMGMFVPINYIILEALHYGMKPSLAQYLVPILNAGSFFGRTIPGVIADKIGKFNMMVIMNFFTGIVILAMWIPSTSNAPIIAFAVLFGIGSGAFVSLVGACSAQISDVRQIGVRQGTVFCVISIAALIGNPIGGALISTWHGSYVGLQIFSGVLCTAGAAVYLLARLRLGGFDIKAKV